MQTRCHERTVEQLSENNNSEPRREIEPPASGVAVLLAMENFHPDGRGMPSVEV